MMEILDPKNCTQMMAMFNKKKSQINLPNPLITEISMGWKTLYSNHKNLLKIKYLRYTIERKLRKNTNYVKRNWNRKFRIKKEQKKQERKRKSLTKAPQKSNALNSPISIWATTSLQIPNGSLLNSNLLKIEILRIVRVKNRFGRGSTLNRTEFQYTIILVDIG